MLWAICFAESLRNRAFLPTQSNRSLCNVLAAYEAGARRFDAALGGLGGCPFAPGASGNICTEDLVNLCDEIGIHTGINLPLLLQLSRGLPALLAHEVPGQLAKAGRNCDLHPTPS